MSVNAASRLELVRGMGSGTTSHDSQNDEGLRCYWSVYILETVFTPPFALLSQNTIQPNYPSSMREPSSPYFLEGYEFAPDLVNIEEDDRSDPGITVHALWGMTAWGNVISYLHRVRMGYAGSPSQTDSTFYRLASELHDLENQLGHKHFLRNVGFSRQTTEELESHREYWIPWLLFQVAAHAAHGLLNHLFVHLVVLRNTA
ncbi:hypothetical protein BFJ70_g17109 [Fusarium oxysporum]|nr:hypothetical protein BFJ70_g17109 [Fusarium oxysporum]